MQHGKIDVGASGVRANHEFRPRSYEVVSATVAPKHVREDNELIGQQVVVCGELATTAERRVRPELRRSNGCHRGVNAGKKTRKFRVKVSGAEMGVVGGLGDDVWHQVRRSRVGVVIELRTN